MRIWVSIVLLDDFERAIRLVADDQEVQAFGLHTALRVELVVAHHEVDPGRAHRLEIVGGRGSAALDRVRRQPDRIVARDIPVRRMVIFIEVRLHAGLELADELLLRRRIAVALDEERGARKADLAGLRAYLPLEDARRRRIIREQRRRDAGFGVLLDEAGITTPLFSDYP